MRRASLRRRAGARLAAVWRAIAAPPGNAVGRLAWRCRRAGIGGADLDVLGDAILARLQAGIIQVAHAARQAEAAPAPATEPATMPEPALPESEVVPQADAAGAVIYAWRPGADGADGRLLSLRAWLDYMRERGRLSPHEWARLCELGHTPDGIHYLIRLRDYYDGSGPHPGEPLAEPVLRTGTAA
jgi:hypothetical protein